MMSTRVGHSDSVYLDSIRLFRIIQINQRFERDSHEWNKFWFLGGGGGVGQKHFEPSVAFYIGIYPLSSLSGTESFPLPWIWTPFLVFSSQSFSSKPPAVLELLHQDTRMTYFSPANMNVEKVRWRPDMGGCKSGRREREVAKRGTDHTKHKTREAYERLNKRLGRRR